MNELQESLDFKNLKIKRLKVKFDLRMLDLIIAFIFKDSKLRTRKNLHNIQKLFSVIDKDIYQDKPELLDRIWIIETALKTRLDSDFENDEMVKQVCTDSVECDATRHSIINGIGDLKISYDESKYLIKQIEDRLQFGFILSVKEITQRVFDSIDADDYKTYKAVYEDVYNIAASIINIKRGISSIDSDQTFSLRDEYFEDVVKDALERLKDKDKIFTTGIQYWNIILAPGYLSKRLYTYLALPGGGKSQVLLKSAIDIKRYNGRIKPKDPNKNPTVLYITMENDIDETVERLFNMVAEADDIRNYTSKQVIRKLKNEGQMTLSEANSIDIMIKYYPNRSIDTNDLYTIISDISDNGGEVIALILDYMKRIRPAERGKDEKEELKNITNELKTLAKTLDIPVITAQQLNRSASSVIDKALEKKSTDVARLVGRDGVAGAWEIIENSDFVCLLQQETQRDTGIMYMTFKLLKRRYRSADDDESHRRLDYFSHPYDVDNTIRLIDDVFDDKPKSVLSLAGESPITKQKVESPKKVIDTDLGMGWNDETEDYT